jgi:hypothetical protein
MLIKSSFEVIVFFLGSILGATLKPHDFSTASKVPFSKQVIRNSDKASDKLSLAFFLVSPWVTTSKAGHDATYHLGFFTNLMGSLIIISTLARIPNPPLSLDECNDLYRSLPAKVKVDS